MTETTTELSSALTGDEFSKKLTSWNFTVEGNTALEKAFGKKADKRIKKAYGGNSDNDVMTRDVISSSLFNAESAEDFHDSQGGWIHLGLDDEIDARAARAKDFQEKYETLLVELSEGVTDQFERYGIERYVPYVQPRKVTDTLGFIATSKANLISIDEFTRENEGKVFQQVGVLAFTAGVFAEGGITIERRGRTHQLFFPTVPHSVYSGYYDGRGDAMGILDHQDEKLSSNARQYEAGIPVQPVQDLLKSDTFWKSKTSRTPLFSIGAVPQGPFFIAQNPENPHYQTDLDFYEKHVVALRLITQLAINPELRSSVEFLK